jgi:hypothetical protein
MSLPTDQLVQLAERLLEKRFDARCLEWLGLLNESPSDATRAVDVLVEVANARSRDVCDGIDIAYDAVDSVDAAFGKELSLTLKAVLLLHASRISGYHDIPDHIGLEISYFMSPSLRVRLAAVAMCLSEPDDREWLMDFLLLPDGNGPAEDTAE